MQEKLAIEYGVPGLEPTYTGKVREIYDLGDELVIVATDRISTYDVILPDRIPGKGRLLTRLSSFWFRGIERVVRTHFISDRRSDLPEPFRSAPALEGRAVRARKARRFDVECIVRGYLAGSAVRDYERSGRIGDVRLPKGLRPFARLPEPVFTPTTKASKGHDQPITFDEMAAMLGRDVAERLRALSLEIYARASEYALARGVIIADTKFEFGERDGGIMLIDEALTPDSSRFWDREGHEPGREPEPMDKQYVRNAVDAMGWDHTAPGPRLSAEQIAETRRRYETAVQRITGGDDAPRWEGNRP
jgi:phosphoribosylaminoimidazole-succinocarboxamide synthase